MPGPCQLDAHDQPLLAEQQPDFTLGVPVIAFDLPDSVRVQEFMVEAFQRISVRLISRAVTAESLSVTERRWLEESDR